MGSQWREFSRGAAIISKLRASRVVSGRVSAHSANANAGIIASLKIYPPGLTNSATPTDFIHCQTVRYVHHGGRQ
jgi:hypothetical protein